MLHCRDVQNLPNVNYITVYFSFFTNTNFLSAADSDDFWPDPAFENVQIFWKFFRRKYVLKSIFMIQKVKQQRFLKYLRILHISKKLRGGHLLRTGSGFGSDRIRIRNTASNLFWRHLRTFNAAYIATRKPSQAIMYVKHYQLQYILYR
jgi:hypothetical protein